MDDSTNGYKFLMPGIEEHDYVHDDQDCSGYTELSKVPLPQLLRTHIIGTDGNYLLPVAHIIQLTEGALGRGEITQWQMNPYYTLKLSDKAAYLRDAEVNRLWHHSAESRALYQKAGELIRAEKEQPTLLSQLRLLYKELAFMTRTEAKG